MIYGYIKEGSTSYIMSKRKALGECDKIIGAQLCESQINTPQNIVSEEYAEYGNQSEKKELLQAIEKIQKGDTFRVVSLKELPLTALQLIEMVDSFNAKEIKFETIDFPIQDQTIFSHLAELNKKRRFENAQIGLKNIRPRGRKGGRKNGLSEDAKRKAYAAAELYKGKTLSIDEILKTLKIGSRSTLYRYLAHERVEVGAK